MKDLKYIYVVLSFFIITSCGVKKTTTSKKMLSSSEKVLAEYESNKTKINTISAKIDAFFTNNKTSMSGTISLRMEKGKIIWLSISKLGFTVAKMKITPSKIQYYEKWQEVYFDGDFSLITEKMGVPLSFEQLENVLLGQSVVSLSETPFSFDIEQNSYKFQLQNAQDFLKYMLLMRSDNFKMKKQYVSYKAEQFLTIDYNSYQRIGNQNFPKKINLVASTIKQKTNIQLKYRRVELDKRLRYPFRIPKGYKKIEL